ncbi:hypothetical protein PAHAL_7G211600 [Panicum hallii]|uniref:Secreted protein n=1 Tax=Panicum hallii TaxID=206008 RepID=A0A2T8ICZ6_9POAL|nr:hypothetical protein PAHAL_7G211600 [Panicum hallii]
MSRPHSLEFFVTNALMFLLQLCPAYHDRVRAKKRTQLCCVCWLDQVTRAIAQSLHSSSLPSSVRGKMLVGWLCLAESSSSSCTQHLRRDICLPRDIFCKRMQWSFR